MFFRPKKILCGWNSRHKFIFCVIYKETEHICAVIVTSKVMHIMIKDTFIQINISIENALFIPIHGTPQ